MRHKPVDQICSDDILALVDSEVREGRHLDYKEKVPTNSNDDKRDFLADVVAFANSGGGDIIFGIAEKRDGSGNTGLPMLKSLSREGLDKECRRLEQIIQSNISPRVPGAVFKEVDMGGDGVVLVLRIPPSWAGPHMIWDGRSHFYARSGLMNLPLDTTQIRGLFAESENVVERVRRFRLGRIAKILGGEAPTTVGDKPCLVLHVVSVSSQAPGATQLALDGSLRHADASNFRLRPPGSSGWTTRFNLDGLCAFNGNRAEDSGSYVLLFRVGAVESVRSHITQSGKQIPGKQLEVAIAGDLTDHVRVLRTLGVQGPLAVSMSFLNVKGFGLGLPAWSHGDDDTRKFDRPTLLIPDSIIEGAEATAADLEPMFDLLWQSAGYDRSPRERE